MKFGWKKKQRFFPELSRAWEWLCGWRGVYGSFFFLALPPLTQQESNYLTNKRFEERGTMSYIDGRALKEGQRRATFFSPFPAIPQLFLVSGRYYKTTGICFECLLGCL